MKFNVLWSQVSNLKEKFSKLKREGMIANTYSANRIIRLSCNKISNGRIQKVSHISYLFEHFPDFDFGLEDNENADESGLANESLQSSY